MLLHPPPGGYDRELLVNCDEELTRTKPCNEHVCDSNCKLSDWIPFSDGPCTAECGFMGRNVLRRTVIQSATGNGHVCIRWDHKRRQKLEDCNKENHRTGENKCPDRCEAAPGGPLTVVAA